MQTKKICYSDICNIHYLKKGLIIVKSHINFKVSSRFKRSCIIEKWGKLFKSLRIQKYKPKCSKKVSIFQIKTPPRRFGLIFIIDKVVQRRILELLVPVAEWLFYEQSFGFRSRKGSHDALKYVKAYWLNVIWIVRLDIEKHLARMDYKILLAQMYHFMDQSSLELIGKFYDVECTKTDHFVKFPQILEQISHGFTFFPLLCNVYFHNFDEFVLTHLMSASYIKDTLNLSNPKSRQTYRTFRKNAQGKIRKICSYKHIFGKAKLDLNSNTLYYVRYVANFMFGYTGERWQANYVYDTIINYINDNLKFLLYSGGVYSAFSNSSVKYLGTWLFWDKNSNKDSLKTFNSFKGSNSISLNWPYLFVPLDYLFMEIVLKKYDIRKSVRTKIARVALFSNIIAQNLYCIVKSFNRIIRHVVNYYSFVGNRNKLWEIIDAYRNSCASTIANKLKLKIATQVFQKFGRLLTLKNNLGQEVAYLDAWPYNLKTIKKFNTQDFKTNFSSLVKKIDNYSGGFYSACDYN